MQYVPPVNGNTGDPDRPYINADPAIGVRGSIPPGEAVEHPQREILSVIEAAGLTPDGGDLTQLQQSIEILIANAAAPPSTLPVGSEIMWQNAVIPAGWLEQNGATFSQTTYPALYAHLGSNVLPDMRGEFPRGWDHGRGIDSGRTLGSTQSDEFKSHNHWSGADVSAPYVNTGSSPLATTRYGAGTSNPYYTFTSSSGGAETRPRNVAKIFLIKAA